MTKVFEDTIRPLSRDEKSHADKILYYWKRRGHTRNIKFYEEYSVARALDGTIVRVWGLRSDMKNGLPQYFEEKKIIIKPI